jgi:hypothetical protein
VSAPEITAGSVYLLDMAATVLVDLWSIDDEDFRGAAAALEEIASAYRRGDRAAALLAHETCYRHAEAARVRLDEAEQDGTPPAR